MGFPDMEPLAESAAEQITEPETAATEVAAEAAPSEAISNEEPTGDDVDAQPPAASTGLLLVVDASREVMTEISADASFNGQSSPDAFSAEELMPDDPIAATAVEVEDASLKAVLEAIIYVTDEPLTLDQIAVAIEQPRERVAELLEQLAWDYEQPSRGLSIKEVAGGYKMATKPEHHEAVRRFVKNLNPPLKLSLPALETLAVIAYKQPITAPEIMEIRGVQGAGVLKTLLDRKLIAAAGRKHVIGKPILYKTTREFLVQFGLKDVTELPTLKEFQEIGRMDTEMPLIPEGPEAPADPDLSVMPEPAAISEESAAVAAEPVVVESETPTATHAESSAAEVSAPEEISDATASAKNE